jgi:hypothetical protein
MIKYRFMQAKGYYLMEGSVSEKLQLSTKRKIK